MEYEEDAQAAPKALAKRTAKKFPKYITFCTKIGSDIFKQDKIKQEKTDA